MSEGQSKSDGVGQKLEFWNTGFKVPAQNLFEYISSEDEMARMCALGLNRTIVEAQQIKRKFE